MDDNVVESDSQAWKSLHRIPDGLLRHPNREGDGTVYGDLLLELQIRTEHHAAFFNYNIRPFRNKQDISKLIAKGDDNSLLKVSKTYITAYGNITWGKDRRWLLKAEELEGGEEALQYIPPRIRQEGDYDRFYEILQDLWKQMRGIIFEYRPHLPQSTSIHGFMTPDHFPRDYRHDFTHPMTAYLPTRQDTGYSRPAQYCTPNLFPHDWMLYNPTIEQGGGWIGNSAATGEAIDSEGYWSASRTEQVIFDAITELKKAQRESRPEVFKTLWQRHLARLEEIEQFEEQESRMAASQDKTVEKINQEIMNEDQTTLAENNDVDEANNTNLELREEDTVMVDTAQPVQPPSDPSSTIKTLCTKPSTTDQTTNTDSTISTSNQYRQTIPPTFHLTAYVPPSVPNLMTVYITPHTPSNMHYSQPWVWPDAPVHPTSYTTFRNGIRLRAGITDSVPNEKISMVFGYGWNDFCCIVKDENSWMNWFIKDLRHAGKRGGVSVWRMRVCVVVEADGGRDEDDLVEDELVSE